MDDDTQEVAPVIIATAPAETARSQRAHGTGHTTDIDEGHHDPLLTAFRAKALEARLMGALGTEAAGRREEYVRHTEGLTTARDEAILARNEALQIRVEAQAAAEEFGKWADKSDGRSRSLAFVVIVQAVLCMGALITRGPWWIVVAWVGLLISFAVAVYFLRLPKRSYNKFEWGTLESTVEVIPLSRAPVSLVVEESSAAPDPDRAA